MSSSASEATLRHAARGAVLVLALLAVLFYQFQNSGRPVGGAIALPKLLWLAGALLLWGVLPPLLALDARLPPGLRRAFATLAGLMAARAVVEGWMLYVTFNWSPWYGIAHDALCALLLAGAVARPAAQPAHAPQSPHPSHPPRAPQAPQRSRPPDRLARLAHMHAGVTAAFFLPEIYFAWTMQANFNTQGESAVYFVPDDPRYLVVLRVTSVTVALLFAYLAVFLKRWPGAPRARA